MNSFQRDDRIRTKSGLIMLLLTLLVNVALALSLLFEGEGEPGSEVVILEGDATSAVEHSASGGAADGAGH